MPHIDLAVLTGYYHGHYFLQRFASGVPVYELDHGPARVRFYSLDALRRFIDASDWTGA